LINLQAKLKKRLIKSNKFDKISIGGLKIKRFYKINQYISAEKVRIIGEKGAQVGVLPTQEALFKARQKGLDLVEVAPNANPPVCKLIDFKKFMYQEKKKQRAGKKKKRQDLKQIRFTPFIAKGDFEVRVNRAKEFLNQGHKVKLTVKFVGRQITRKQFGYDLIKKAVKQLENISKIETEPKFQGKLLMMVIKPSKKQEEKKDKDAKTKDEKISSKKV